MPEGADVGAREQAEVQEPAAHGPRVVYGDDCGFLAGRELTQPCEIGVQAPSVAKMKVIFI